MKNKILIIGCGRLGASIANHENELGGNVIVVDEDERSFDRLDDSYSGYKIAGDATDQTVLENAYVKTASEVIITTGDDNINLFLAHLCSKIYQVPQVYVRFNDPEKSLLILGMNVHAIYPFELSLNKFTAMENGGEGK
ncbi:MAG: NAD-binding protein [Bacilli bacterium]|jgi:trk system potassium uptake protein TrkA|nr:NAD-binding protein [Bacilli bacterium]MCI2110730.1 NAD-binding protein [Bacilli bacterium]